MRVIYLLLLLVFIGAIVIFCVQNLETITVTYLQWSMTIPLPLLAFLIYLLGMFSGASVLSFMRRSIHRVTDEKK
jgi:putative membrane protein